MQTTTRATVWDLPTRLFHWALAILILLQYGTADWHWLSMQWHVYFGYATLALIAFRIAWGFAGSQTSRFADFVRGPRRVIAYVRELVAGRKPFNIGHNPLGALSVLALLLCLLVQTITGLFTSNHRHTEFGPLASHVPQAWVATLTTIHQVNQNILLVLIGLHIAAILAYLIGGENLIGPMLSGHRDLAPMAPLRRASSLRALLLLAIAALIVAGVAWWGSVA